MVLGPTGRNLGAGMSGGVAYILDLDFECLNPAAVANEEFLLTKPGGDDDDRLRQLLQRHVEFTGSSGAAAQFWTRGHSPDSRNWFRGPTRW